MVRQENSEDASWDPVAPGSLNGLASRIRSRRRRKQVTRAAVPMLAVTLVASLIPLVAESSPEKLQSDGEMTCIEVRANLQPYIVKRLDAERMAAIEAHLTECPQCQRRKEAMRKPGVATSRKGIQEFFTIGSLDHRPAWGRSVK